MTAAATINQTQAEYWLDHNGKWRIATKSHHCDGIGTGAKNACQGYGRILPGHRYLDTGEIIRPPYGTMKMCVGCAYRDAYEGRNYGH
jgi:hypothetical protein